MTTNAIKRHNLADRTYAYAQRILENEARRIMAKENKVTALCELIVKGKIAKARKIYENNEHWMRDCIPGYALNVIYARVIAKQERFVAIYVPVVAEQKRRAGGRR